MSNLTVEKLEEILEEKLRKVIQPLSKQIDDAMQSVNALNTKYDQIVKTLKDLDEAKDKQIMENASLKAEILKSSNEVKFLKKSLNDLEQYTRRDCLEIQGIPLSSTPTDLDQTDEGVLQIAVTKMAAKWLKSIPYLWEKRLKNPTLWGRTYLYSPY